MISIACYPSHRSVIEGKLRELSFPFEYGAGSIHALSLHTAQRIYLFEREQTLAPNWISTRANLAEAHRHYIIYGDALNSREIVQFIHEGAFDVLDLNDTEERWRQAIAQAQNAQRSWLLMYSGSVSSETELLLGQSDLMRKLRQTIDRVRATDASVLIVGPSGTGKERIALALHRGGKEKPFIAVNCAAIPKDLLEAELFGATKGAYTGAGAERIGLVRQADGGVLFLDEIGDLDLGLQPKLLRFLESHHARPLGGGPEYEVHTRVIASTNCDLQALVQQGRFRLDLYYRLSEVTIQTPALRERIEDLPLLATAFLQEASQRFGKHFDAIEPELLALWKNYSWPGNVRELKHVIEQLVLFYDGPILRANWWQLPMSSTISNPLTTPHFSNTLPPMSVSSLPSQSQDYRNPQTNYSTEGLNRRQRFELARRLLQESDNDYAWVAQRMNIHTSTLYRWRMKGLC